MAGDYHEVDFDEPKVAYFPDKLRTDGLGPCMGVGILNKKKKIAYLGHYLSFDKSSTSLIDMAISENGGVDGLEAVLAGNIPIVEESPDKIKDINAIISHGKYILKYIQDKGIKKINNHLADKYAPGAYRILIDTEKSKTDVKYDHDVFNGIPDEYI